MLADIRAASGVSGAIGMALNRRLMPCTESVADRNAADIDGERDCLQARSAASGTAHSYSCPGNGAHDLFERDVEADGEHDRRGDLGEPPPRCAAWA